LARVVTRSPDLFKLWRLTEMSSLGDVINRWRKSLGLEAIDTAVGSALARELKIPFTYCWSPSLVPKPSDWPSYIGISRHLSLSLPCLCNK